MLKGQRESGRQARHQRRVGPGWGLEDTEEQRQAVVQRRLGDWGVGEETQHRSLTGHLG